METNNCNTISSTLYFNIIIIQQDKRLKYDPLSTTPDFVVSDRGCCREGALYLYIEYYILGRWPSLQNKIFDLTCSRTQIN